MLNITHKIHKSILEQYIQHANESPDAEIIGAFSGRRNGNVWESTKYTRIKNLALERSTHPAFKTHQTKTSLNGVVDFVPEPNEWFGYLRSTKVINKDSDYEHIALTHTHPHSAPIPSRWDMDGSGTQNHGLSGFFLIYSNVQKKFNTYFIDELGQFILATTIITEEI